MDENILALIESGGAIPSMPQIVTRLMEITHEEDYKIEDVINLLSTDAGVASDVLRLANSPLFGLTRKVSSLTHATALLGIKRIRTLVMGRCMVEKVNAGDEGIIDGSYYWRRSLATAVLAARFAEYAAPRQREEAFMSGLLSDVGVVVLARALPDKYAPAARAYAPKRDTDLIAVERDTVGVTHPDVSALVLERWALPLAMSQAVRHHHDRPIPADLPETVGELARVVSGAADISSLLCEVPDQSVIADTCTQAMEIVGLGVGVLGRILTDIETDVSELASVLNIDVIPSRVYELIAKTVADELTPQSA